MKALKSIWTASIVGALCAGTPGRLWAQQPAADGGKRILELPTKKLIANQSSPPPPAEVSPEVSDVLARHGFKVPASAKSPDNSANPKVAPGKLRWHATFADACDASQKSGKPVLLFQMLGKLDDQFC